MSKKDFFRTYSWFLWYLTDASNYTLSKMFFCRIILHEGPRIFDIISYKKYWIIECNRIAWLVQCFILIKNISQWIRWKTRNWRIMIQDLMEIIEKSEYFLHDHINLTFIWWKIMPRLTKHRLNNLKLIQRKNILQSFFLLSSVISLNEHPWGLIATSIQT